MSAFTWIAARSWGSLALMGAGRTELMKVIYGALPSVNRGDIVLDGKVINPLSPQDGLANGIAYISEDRKGDGLILGLSVKENMSICSLESKLSNGVQLSTTTKSPQLKTSSPFQHQDPDPQPDHRQPFWW